MNGGKLTDGYLPVLLNDGSKRRHDVAGLPRLFGVRMALIRGNFSLFKSFDDPFYLAYGQDLVTLHFIHQHFYYFVVFSTLARAATKSKFHVSVIVRTRWGSGE
jgi:hypothetical protein